MMTDNEKIGGLQQYEVKKVLGKINEPPLTIPKDSLHLMAMLYIW